jgi:hypothetical protein
MIGLMKTSDDKLIAGLRRAIKALTKTQQLVRQIEPTVSIRPIDPKTYFNEHSAL